jgi:hypothetical protein
MLKSNPTIKGGDAVRAGKMIRIAGPVNILSDIDDALANGNGGINLLSCEEIILNVAATTIPRLHLSSAASAIVASSKI